LREPSLGALAAKTALHYPVGPRGYRILYRNRNQAPTEFRNPHKTAVPTLRPRVSFGVFRRTCRITVLQPVRLHT